MASLCVRQASSRCLTQNYGNYARNASTASSSRMPTKLFEHTLMVRPLDGFKSMPFVFATLRELEARFGEITHVDIPLTDVAGSSYSPFGFVSFKDRPPTEEGKLHSDYKQIKVKCSRELSSPKPGGPSLQDIAGLLQRKDKLSSPQWNQLMDKVNSDASSTVMLELSTRVFQGREPKLSSTHVRAVCQALGNFSGFSNPPTKEMLAVKSRWSDRAARLGIKLAEAPISSLPVDPLAEYLEDSSEADGDVLASEVLPADPEPVKEDLHAMEDTRPTPETKDEPTIAAAPEPIPDNTALSEGSEMPKDIPKRPSKRQLMLQKAKTAAYLAEQQRVASAAIEKSKPVDMQEEVIQEEVIEKNEETPSREKKRFWLF